MKYFFQFILFITSAHLFGQETPMPKEQKDSTFVKNEITSIKKNKGVLDTIVLKENQVQEITIKDYKIISFARDTTYLDTTLTMAKEYKYNYLRKDNFELMPFSNIGQPFNQLAVAFERINLYPKLGAKARHFNYTEMEDVDYYNVATPMTDVLFKTTFEEGQLLDALLSFNTSRRLNFSLAYKGMRSLGKYLFNQSESGNFKATSNYVTKNGRYNFRAHYVAQDMINEENGGLSNPEEQFESNDPSFSNRVRVNVRFDDASSKILGKRYFIDHQYKLIKKQKDSSSIEKTSLAIGHMFNYETKFYQFQQTAANSYFGTSFLAEIGDQAKLKTMLNQVSLNFFNTNLGALQANIGVYNYNYFFDSVLITDDQRIENQLKGEELAFGAKYSKQIGKFLVKGAAKFNLSGDLTGSIIDATASYVLNTKNKLSASFHSSGRMPDFNFLLYQSDYSNYNWQNNTIFQKESVNSLSLDFESKLWGNINAKISAIDNYTYFASDPDKAIVSGSENAFIRPFQESNSIEYLKVRYSKEFKVGKFALSNSILYQKVEQRNKVLNVPQFVTRNTLYFSSNIFKKAMFLQTGFHFKYFSSYTMDAYNSVLGEFYVQNEAKLGGYPLFDFFINAKVRQTRIFLKAEHFNAAFGKRNYYAAPNYPYRDFVIRFGVVWNFFS